MGYTDQNVIQHDFGFPPIVRPAEQEEAAYAMLVSLGATRTMANKLMRAYPKYRVPCQAIVDLASDSESDVRVAIAQIDEENAALAAISTAPLHQAPENRLSRDVPGQFQLNAPP